MTTNGHKEINTINDIADEYLGCRDWGHSWVWVDIKYVRERRRIIEIHRIFRCRECGTHRVQVLDPDWYIIPGRSHYTYPEQADTEAQPYLLKGVGHLSAADRAKIRGMSTQAKEQGT